MAAPARDCCSHEHQAWGWEEAAEGWEGWYLFITTGGQKIGTHTTSMEMALRE